MATRELDRLFDSAQASEEASPDRELTLSFQRGDRWAYDLIFRRYSTRVQGICRRMLSDPQDAQDAVQETFLRVYQKLPRFNGEYHLGAWITRIATNVCLDQLRSRSRTRSDAAPNDVLEECAEAEPEATPEEALLRSVEGMRVHETLASLSPLHRRAITMRDLEGRDYRDIASTLGVPEARARVLLHRARKGFKKSWASAGIFLGLPTRLLQRIRRLRDPDVVNLVDAAGPATQATQATPAVAANVHHLAASCSHVVSQCGNVVSEKFAAAATAALMGVGVTATGGASVALSTEPREVLRSPVELSRLYTGEMIEDARDVAAETVAAVEARVEEATTPVTGTVEIETTDSGTNTEPAAHAPAPDTTLPEASFSGLGPSTSPEAGYPGVDPGLEMGPHDSAAGVSDPLLPAEPVGSPAPSPQPSAPVTGPTPEIAPQEPTTPADAPTPSPGPVGEAQPDPAAPTTSDPGASVGNETDTPPTPAPEETPQGLVPGVEPSPTPTGGLWGTAGDALEGTVESPLG